MLFLSKPPSPPPRKVVLLNYADASFKKAQAFNTETGKVYAKFDEVFSRSPQDIPQEFYRANKEILEYPRGNGYWLWKPYFINDVLKTKLKEGDFLFYADSGSYFIRPIDSLIDLSLFTGQDVIVFGPEFMEKENTKRDAFILLDCDTPQYTESGQISATFHLWRNTEYARSFAEEWLHHAQDKRLISDSKSQLGSDYPDFKDHRHDQSILSLLSKKHGLQYFRDPSRRFPEPGYKQLIVRTRWRKPSVRHKLVLIRRKSRILFWLSEPLKRLFFQ